MREEKDAYSELNKLYLEKYLKKAIHISRNSFPNKDGIQEITSQSMFDANGCGAYMDSDQGWILPFQMSIFIWRGNNNNDDDLFNCNFIKCKGKSIFLHI